MKNLNPLKLGLGLFLTRRNNVVNLWRRAQCVLVVKGSGSERRAIIYAVNNTNYADLCMTGDQ